MRGVVETLNQLRDDVKEVGFSKAMENMARDFKRIGEDAAKLSRTATVEKNFGDLGPTDHYSQTCHGCKSVMAQCRCAGEGRVALWGMCRNCVATDPKKAGALKAQVQASIHQEPWFQGIGIGKTDAGFHVVVKASVGTKEAALTCIQQKFGSDSVVVEETGPIVAL